MKRMTTYFVAIGFVAALAATPAVNAQERWPPGNCIDLGRPGACDEAQAMQREFDMKSISARCQNYMDRRLFKKAAECWRHHRELFPPSR
jgi:hypothetical protein